MSDSQIRIIGQWKSIYQSSFVHVCMIVTLHNTFNITYALQADKHWSGVFGRAPTCSSWLHVRLVLACGFAYVSIYADLGLTAVRGYNATQLFPH